MVCWFGGCLPVGSFAPGSISDTLRPDHRLHEFDKLVIIAIITFFVSAFLYTDLYQVNVNNWVRYP